MGHYTILGYPWPFVMLDKQFADTKLWFYTAGLKKEKYHWPGIECNHFFKPLTIKVCPHSECLSGSENL